MPWQSLISILAWSTRGNALWVFKVESVHPLGSRNVLSNFHGNLHVKFWHFIGTSGICGLMVPLEEWPSIHQKELGMIPRKPWKTTKFQGNPDVFFSIWIPNLHYSHWKATDRMIYFCDSSLVFPTFLFTWKWGASPEGCNMSLDHTTVSRPYNLSSDQQLVISGAATNMWSPTGFPPVTETSCDHWSMWPAGTTNGFPQFWVRLCSIKLWKLQVGFPLNWNLKRFSKLDVFFVFFLVWQARMFFAKERKMWEIGF